MFYVFLELPYERQLRRINNTLVENFKVEIKQEAIENGANFFMCHSCFGCTIDSNQIAFKYSISRFLFRINKIFDRYKDTINEIRCIVNYYSDSKISDDFSDLFFEFKKYLVPEQGIYVFGNTVKELEGYIKFEKQSNDIFLCSGFSFFENNKNEKEFINPYSIILHKQENYFWSLYNFMLLNPISEEDILKLSKTDLDSFNSTKNVVSYLKKYRFSKQMPQYFIDAFLANIGIYLKAFIKYKNDSNPINILIDNINDEKNFEEAEKILLVNRSSMIKELQAEMPSVYSIPEDLLELVYIILFAGKYLFNDELDEFLLSLNKSYNFFNDVYEWMYSVGLILIPKNIYAIKYGLLEIIERRIGNSKKKNDLYIAEFLWKKYRTGNLHPNIESENVFKNLKFDIKSDFFISAMFHKYSDSVIEGLDLKKYRSEPFFDSIKYFQNALIAQSDGSVGKAFPLAKTALTSFQDYNFISGEYRALSLLAFFNLNENKQADALTYFLYSLDNAEQTHDSRFICEALFNISIAYFLDNNLKQAMTFLKKLSSIISLYFEQEWKIPCLFMQGRIFLRIGEFEKAKEIFTIAGNFAELYFENLIPICRVWSARALLYIGEIKKAQDIFYSFIDDTDDALLFLLESFLLKPSLKHNFSDLDFDSIYYDYAEHGFNEFEKIKSGFSFAEDLIWYKIYGVPVGKKMFSAFYNFYNCDIANLKLEQNTEYDKYISELELLAMNSLYQKDPYASLYLFFCYKIYSVLKGESASATTAYLSKAFKAMQKSVLSIGENDIRDKYMTQNLWNKKLFKIAKDHKLI